MLNTFYTDLQNQFNAWFLLNAKPNQQNSVSGFCDDFFDAIENNEETYELNGYYTVSGNPEVFYPEVKAGA